MSSKPSLVSVIVPTRNSDRTLGACLESIRTQTYRQVELIVIDNGSTDRSVEIARKYADTFVHRGPERSAQRNHGAQIASGQYLFFIDSDMVLSPNLVSECISTIEATGAPAVVVPEVSVGDGLWAKCRALERSCYAGDDLVEAARFFPRNVFEESGGFDENLTGPEDWDLMVRVAKGKRLPRTTNRITHNEGKIVLRAWLAKKGYYAASFAPYWRKHGLRTILQANVVARPAFFRNWQRLARHPLLTTCLVVLKVLELGSSVSGAASGGFRSRAERR